MQPFLCRDKVGVLTSIVDEVLPNPNGVALCSVYSSSDPTPSFCILGHPPHRAVLCAGRILTMVLSTLDTFTGK